MVRAPPPPCLPPQHLPDFDIKKAGTAQSSTAPIPRHLRLRNLSIDKDESARPVNTYQCPERAEGVHGEPSAAIPRREGALPRRHRQDIHIHCPPIGIMARAIHRPDEEEDEGETESSDRWFCQRHDDHDWRLRAAHGRPPQEDKRSTTQARRGDHQATAAWAKIPAIHKSQL